MAVSIEPSPWVVCIAALLASIFFLLLLLKSHSSRRQLNLPPGPKPWPIIGNLNLIGSLPHHSIHALSRKYGPLMQLRFGSFPVIVASSVEMAKAILMTHDITFASRPKTAAGKYTTYNYADILWSPYGPYWRQARKICLTELFTYKRLESYEYIRVEELRALLHNLFRSSGRRVLLKDHLFTVNLNVISWMVLGNKYTDGSEAGIVTSAEFKEMMEEIFLLNGVLNIGDFIPWLDFLDLQGYIKRMKAVSKKFDTFLEQVLDTHNERRRREGDAFVARDMVDVMLQLADDPNLEVKLHRNGVKAFTQDMIAGGTDTSAVTVVWAISELLKRPDVVEKANEELDRVIGRDRWVEEKDMHHLPYMQAIVKEAMRMHPVVPMLAPHLSTEDCTIAGYDVPAGTRALVNVWTIVRDPAIWGGDAEEFRPERFIGSSIGVKGKDFELLPFGSGRRSCPGLNLGLKMVQVSIANLLHGFALSLPEGMAVEELSMEEIFGLTTQRKVPLEVVLEPRLPAHLYVV